MSYKYVMFKVCEGYELEHIVNSCDMMRNQYSKENLIQHDILNKSYFSASISLIRMSITIKATSHCGFVQPRVDI